MMEPKHFLDLRDFSSDQLTGMLDAASAMKATNEGRFAQGPLKGKVLAMIFDKPSTRTRVSFDIGMRQLGGETIVLSSGDTQLGRGETIADTARVLSRYVDAIMIRTTDHERLLELAKHASVPVINGLTDDSHPCQIMADMLTIKEHKGNLNKQVIAWVGPENNVLNSLIEASGRFGFKLNIGTPKTIEPNKRFLRWAQSEGGQVELFNDAQKTVSGADCIITDTWVSMHEDENSNPHNLYMPFQVNAELMSHAKSDAIFMHCLPAHRNEEVTDGVIDSSQSVVFDEAENRLHAQKAVLAWALSSPN